eukprot:gb/GECH01013936.1/.p1 GENE.gb/GECH01013936.1/~~gb/GECH01013936.1/.p1  ORF type:complete len:387 (+),score=117.57 gb/GECH01013936.1/:1-1161(+)
MSTANEQNHNPSVPSRSRSSSGASEELGVEVGNQLLSRDEVGENTYSANRMSPNKRKQLAQFVVIGVLCICCGIVGILLFINYENKLEEERNQALVEEKKALGVCVLRNNHHQRLGLARFEDDLEENPLRVSLEVGDLPKNTKVKLQISEYGDMTDEQSLEDVFSIEDEKIGELTELKTNQDGKLNSMELEFDDLSLKGERSVLGRGFAIIHEDNIEAHCVIGAQHPEEEKGEKEAQTVNQDTNSGQQAVAVIKPTPDTQVSGEFLFTQEKKDKDLWLRVIGTVDGLEDDKAHYGVFVSHFGDEREGGSYLGEEFATVGRIMNIHSGSGCINTTLVSIHDELLIAGEMDNSVVGKSLVLSTPYTSYVASAVIGLANPDTEVDSGSC